MEVFGFSFWDVYDIGNMSRQDRRWVFLAAPIIAHVWSVKSPQALQSHVFLKRASLRRSALLREQKLYQPRHFEEKQFRSRKESGSRVWSGLNAQYEKRKEFKAKHCNLLVISPMIDLLPLTGVWRCPATTGQFTQHASKIDNLNIETFPNPVGRTDTEGPFNQMRQKTPRAAKKW